MKSLCWDGRTRGRPLFESVLVALGVALLLWVLGSFAWRFQEIGFVLPSGKIAALMQGVAWTSWDGQSLSYQTSQLTVEVTKACSGYRFFCILSGWLIYRLWPLGFGGVVPLLFLCWVLTITVNAMRVVASVLTRQLGDLLLPESYRNLVHEGTGMLVFLTSLIVISLILAHLHPHESRLHADEHEASA